MKALRYGIVALMAIIFLVGCGGQVEGTVSKEVMVQLDEPQSTSVPMEEEECYPIISTSISSMPTTGINGHIDKDEYNFLTYITICYKKNDEFVFKTLSTNNQNLGDYEVHFKEGKEDKLTITVREGGVFELYDEKTIIYTIWLTEKTYQSIC